MAAILVVGLNPAWQRLLVLDKIEIGAVNRARDIRELASGKGINLAKALLRLGHEVWLLQILAGENGRRCLAACEAWGIRSLPVWNPGETRCCTTLLTPRGEATELIEPFRISDPNVKELLESALSSAPVFSATVICGSIPEGLETSLYADLIACTAPSPVVWDSVEVLRPECLPRIVWIKVNSEEHARLRPMLDTADALARPAQLITAGPGISRVVGAKAADGNYRTPTLREIRNPIGAGDTVTAGLTDAWLRGLDPEAAVRRALSLGAASCENLLPAEWDEARARIIEAGIRREAA